MVFAMYKRVAACITKTQPIASPVKAGLALIWWIRREANEAVEASKEDGPEVVPREAIG